MLPPILEIFVVWHPDDEGGANIADAVFDHFMLGSTFSGVIGGGIQVSFRSAEWTGAGSSPRPIYTAAHPAPNGIPPASFTAIIPILGRELASHLENGHRDWTAFVRTIANEQAASPDTVAIFPYPLNGDATDGTLLGNLLGQYQLVATAVPVPEGDTLENAICRDITQGLVQLISPDIEDRLTVFISHTKRHSSAEGEDVDELVSLVRDVIRSTRLREFFDASDLQPGSDWDEELRRNSATSALLSIRTDLYSSREWCQREVVIAKCAGMPVITMDAIGVGEERGSFLMDHVPRVAVRKLQEQWQRRDVYRALNLLVDECLKRALWLHQRELARERPELDVAWWAPHAPEPVTLSNWIEAYLQREDGDGDESELRILHPDPPLGPEEREVLRKYIETTRLGRQVDIMTPRQLAARGG